MVIDKPSTEIFPISMVLNPAVLDVTDWNQAASNLSLIDKLAKVSPFPCSVSKKAKVPITNKNIVVLIATL